MNTNSFITTRPLAVPMLQVPVTVALLPHQPVRYNKRNQTRIIFSKTNLTLTCWSQGKKKKHIKMAWVKLEQVMNVTLEGRRYYLRSRDDKRTIKVTEEIFHIKYPKIHLININHTLENLKEHLEDETNKVKKTLQMWKRHKTCIP